MSVAIVYAGAFPEMAVPCVLLATLVGYSRVVLGVHYPSDVRVGQIVAVLADLTILILA